jgi:glycosyltransferase involved in cell wall biosynthesis
VRVVHISTYISGGAGRAAFRLHKALLALPGIQSTFITPSTNIKVRDPNILGIRCKEPNIMHKVANRLGFPILNSQKNFRYLKGLNGNFEMFSMATSDYNLEGLESIIDADVINLHWISNFINYPAFFQTYKNKPVVWTLHDMNPFLGGFHYKNDYNNNPDYRPLENRTYKIKHKALSNIENLSIVTPSKWLMTEAIKSNHFKLGTKFHVIPNGLDLVRFRPIGRATAKSNLKINPDVPCILIIAEYLKTYRKGYDIFLDALMSLSAIPFQLITIGSNRLDIGGKFNVNELGSVNNDGLLVEAYTAADLVVLPSREDNLPNVMLESFACGTPVLSFNTGGMKDWIIPGFNGLLADSLDVEGLKGALEKFLLGQYSFDNHKIREFSIANFSQNQQAQSYYDLYRSIID